MKQKQYNSQKNSPKGTKLERSSVKLFFKNRGSPLKLDIQHKPYLGKNNGSSDKLKSENLARNKITELSLEKKLNKSKGHNKAVSMDLRSLLMIKERKNLGSSKSKQNQKNLEFRQFKPKFQKLHSRVNFLQKHPYSLTVELPKVDQNNKFSVKFVLQEKQYGKKKSNAMSKSISGIQTKHFLKKGLEKDSDKIFTVMGNFTKDHSNKSQTQLDIQKKHSSLTKSFLNGRLGGNIRTDKSLIGFTADKKFLPAFASSADISLQNTRKKRKSLQEINRAILTSDKKVKERAASRESIEVNKFILEEQDFVIQPSKDQPGKNFNPLKKKKKEWKVSIAKELDGLTIEEKVKYEHNQAFDLPKDKIYSDYQGNYLELPTFVTEAQRKRFKKYFNKKENIDNHFKEIEGSNLINMIKTTESRRKLQEKWEEEMKRAKYQYHDTENDEIERPIGLKSCNFSLVEVPKGKMTKVVQMSREELEKTLYKRRKSKNEDIMLKKAERELKALLEKNKKKSDKDKQETEMHRRINQIKREEKEMEILSKIKSKQNSKINRIKKKLMEYLHLRLALGLPLMTKVEDEIIPPCPYYLPDSKQVFLLTKMGMLDRVLSYLHKNKNYVFQKDTVILF